MTDQAMSLLTIEDTTIQYITEGRQSCAGTVEIFSVRSEETTIIVRDRYDRAGRRQEPSLRDSAIERIASWYLEITVTHQIR